MALVNYERREILLKFVYSGANNVGKTANLSYIYNHLAGESGNKLSLCGMPFFCCDFALRDYSIFGFTARVCLYRVPEGIEYGHYRRMIYEGVDGVVIIVDSNELRCDKCLILIEELDIYVRNHGCLLKDMPLVLQFNKRAHADTMPVNLSQRLASDYNYRGPCFEAIAHEGLGVLETYAAIQDMVLHRLQ